METCHLNRKDILIAHQWVLQISWKGYGLPGPAPGALPQFISQVQVPAHRSKADTIEQLFFSYRSMKYIQKYPEEWITYTCSYLVKLMSQY